MSDKYDAKNKDPRHFLLFRTSAYDTTIIKYSMTVPKLYKIVLQKFSIQLSGKLNLAFSVFYGWTKKAK